MSLSASQGTLLLLTQRKSDLELRAQQISQKRLILAQQLEDISREYEEATSNRQMLIGVYGGPNKDQYDLISKNLTYALLVSGTRANKRTSSKNGIQTPSDYTEGANVCSQSYRLVTSDGCIVVASKSEIPTTDTTTYPTSRVTISTNTGDSYSDSALAQFVGTKGQEAATNNSKISAVYGTYTIGDTTQDVIAIQYTDKDDNVAKYKYFTTDGKELEGVQDESLDIAELNTDFHPGETTANSTNDTYEKTASVVKAGNVWVCRISSTKTSINDSNIETIGNDMYRATINGEPQKYIVDPALASKSKDGDSGPNYLQDCLRNGKYMIEMGYDNPDSKEFEWKSLAWDATANISDTYYTEDDDKAKAKYDRLQAQIQADDKKLEVELDEIETQRSAVTTEIESVQKVIDDNVKATFNNFNA